MFEEVEMKNNHMKTRLNLQYIQFVPHRQHICSDEKVRLATAVLVHGCSLHCELHTFQRESGSQSVKINCGRNLASNS